MNAVVANRAACSTGEEDRRNYSRRSNRSENHRNQGSRNLQEKNTMEVIGRETRAALEYEMG